MKIRRYSAMPLPVLLRTSFVCAITSPLFGGGVTEATPVTITGTLTGAAVVVLVKLGATTLGSASIVGLNWSYVWTPQSGDVGARTINAAATDATGLTVNADGIDVTVTAAGGTQYASLLASPLQVVQTDRGLTYGVTPAATGTAPPVATLAGTRTKDGAVPLWFKCTTGGVIGSGAVFAAYVDGTGTTPVMSGITPTAGTPIAITGSSVLSGMTVAWAAGTANTNNVYKALCEGLQDQSGAGKHYTQTDVTLQMEIKIGLNGKCSLALGGSAVMSSALNLVAGTSLIVIVRIADFNNNFALVDANSIVNGAAITQFTTTPQLLMYAGGSTNNKSSTLALATWGAVEASWTNSASDFIRCGSASAVSAGASAGNPSGTGRRIGAGVGGPSVNGEFLMAAYYPPQSTVALRAALNALAGYGVGSISA